MKKTPLPMTVLPAAALLLVSACGGASTPPADVSPPSASSTSSPTTSGNSAGGASPAPASSSASGSGSVQKPVAAEKNPPGDIPDNVAFVGYTNAVGRYSFTHPEGWLQQVTGPRVLFTDKLNGVEVRPGTTTTEATLASVKADSVPALTRNQAAFELRSVAPASVPGGKGVLIVYRRNSAPNQVTGRQYRDEVQRYELVSNGRAVVVELFGPVGADNVDAYRTMITSLRHS